MFKHAIGAQLAHLMKVRESWWPLASAPRPAMREGKPLWIVWGNHCSIWCGGRAQFLWKSRHPDTYL